MKPYCIVVECAIEYQGKFLIIKRPKGVHAEGLLAFPGGKLEQDDESNTLDILRQCAKREVFEEVGLNLEDPLHYITTSFFTDTLSGTSVIDSIFHCVLNKTQPDVVASKREVPEYYWMTEHHIQQAANAPEWLKTYVSLIRAAY